MCRLRGSKLERYVVIKVTFMDFQRNIAVAFDLVEALNRIRSSDNVSGGQEFSKTVERFSDPVSLKEFCCWWILAAQHETRLKPLKYSRKVFRCCDVDISYFFHLWFSFVIVFIYILLFIYCLLVCLLSTEPFFWINVVCAFNWTFAFRNHKLFPKRDKVRELSFLGCKSF